MTNLSGNETWRQRSAARKGHNRPTLGLVLGVGLLMQSVLVGGMLMMGSSTIAPRYFTLAVIWLLISSLLGIFLLLRCAYMQKLRDSKELGEYLLGYPDNELSLATFAAICEEGVAITRDHAIIYANPNFAYLLGATAGDFLGTSIGQHIHKDDRHLLLTQSYMEETSASTRQTLRLVTELGDYRWVVCSVQQLMWRDEMVRLLQFTDISPLKETQTALEETEQQARIFIERAPLGVATFDAMGQLCLANTAWYSVWRSYSADQGRRFNIIQDQFGVHTALNEAAEKAFSKEESQVDEIKATTGWGENRWLNIHFYPMLDPANALTGVIMIQQDTTDLVLAQSKAAHFAAKVRELEEELARLRQALGLHQP